MSNLPKIETVKYEIFLKELNKKIKYRPFTVKEHRILLQAIETGSEDTLINTILDLVKSCTFNALDIDSLPTHVVDYLYLQIHIKSTGVTQEANYKCGNVITQEDGTEKPCGGEFTLKLPLDRATIEYPEGYEQRKIVMVDGKTGIKLKIPDLKQFKEMKPVDNVIDLTDQYVFACVDCIFEGEKTTLKAGIDFNEQDFAEWVGTLDGQVMTKIGDFFRSLPYLKLDLPVTCPNCGKKESIVLRGLDDFFG